MNLNDFIDELAETLEELTKGGAHEGPCENWPNQINQGITFDDYESCYLHLAVSDARRENALQVLERYRSIRAAE